MKKIFLPIFVLLFLLLASQKTLAVECITQQDCLDKGGQHNTDSSCSGGLSCTISNAGCSFNNNTGIWDCPATPKSPAPSSSTEKLCICPLPTAKPTLPPNPCPNGFCETALGKIYTSPAQFVRTIFGIILSLAGGVAIILIMISGYQLMFSQGNPEKVQAAREQLTSAIVGLLFIIFSLTILQVIGVDILKIPGLSK